MPRSLVQTQSACAHRAATGGTTGVGGERRSGDWTGAALDIIAFSAATSWRGAACDSGRVRRGRTPTPWTASRIRGLASP